MFLRQFVFLLIAFAGPAWAQQVLSARAGLINYAEGIAYLDEKPLQFQANARLHVTNDQSLRTESGKVEIQLGAAGTLWMGEGGLLRMEDSGLTHLRLRIEKGSVFVGIMEGEAINKVRLCLGANVIDMIKPGLYRLDSEPPQLRVYEGKAIAQSEWQMAEVKRGRLLEFAGEFRLSGFNMNHRDLLHEWVDYRLWALFNPADSDHITKITKQQAEKQKRERENEEALWQLYDSLMHPPVPETQPEDASGSPPEK